jgi:hypothetical protein
MHYKLFSRLTLIALSAPLVFAEAAGIPDSPIKPPKALSTSASSVTKLACTGLQWIFTGAIVFSIVLILLAAIEYMRSSGEPAKVTSATNKLIWVAVGVAVAILARTLPLLIGGIFGVTGLDFAAACK